ncbi:hypothetical protein [Gloeocapsa sp. PCC 73106]|uniref:hypothetical protein n=1 Tax=Gloeocapsa sp. PCC 73106 TaxID=102232 RepID=UPI0002ABEB1A|nr:hypothetical protein [Gloeocapsa sp. PCC 73106]ELR98187.1 hypothetical protein GLO73106DRAFT_00020140 [Gloeocapsa sp. PCC 73106]
MFELLEILVGVSNLLPPYLITLTIALVIIPTLICILLRFCLYRHLSVLSFKLRKLLRGETLAKPPLIINYLEQRMQGASQQREHINTGALVDGSYSQERFRVLGIPWRCEPMDYLTRNLPNLLLAFGLFGTFLGITINLANLSQTLTQVDLTDVDSLIRELDQPLQGMGIAFVTSLVAIFCSALLTVINFLWNTNVAKSSLLSSLEDYLDNVFWLTLPNSSTQTVQQEIEKLIAGFSSFLGEFGIKLESVMEKSVANPLERMISENQKITQAAEKAYLELRESSQSMAKSTGTFDQAVNVLDKSRFPEKLSSAISELAIAQNQFSQSALVLNKSTKSIEDTLELMQKSILRIIRLTEEMTSINEKYNLILKLNQAKSETHPIQE